MSDDAGSFLVRAGLVQKNQLGAAQESLAKQGGTIAEHLVLGGHVSDEELTDFYSETLMVPRINPDSLSSIPKRLLKMIPKDMAAEFRVVPVAIDREQNLTLAMSDPSQTRAADEIGFFTGAYVVRAVATQAEIAWCLAHYYDHLTPLAETLVDDDSIDPMEDAPTEAEAADTDIMPAEDRPDDIADGVPKASHEEFEAKSDTSPGKGKRGRPVPKDTGPTANIPVRKAKKEEDRPELAPCAGEINAHQHQDRLIDEGPRVVLDQAALAPDTVRVPRMDTERDIEPRDDITASGEIIVLDRPKAPSEPVPAPTAGRRPGDTARGFEPAKKTKHLAGKSIDEIGKRSTGPNAPTERIRRRAPTNPPVSSPSELELSSTRLVETLRDLEKNRTRDDVIDTLMAHVAGVCDRVAFFSVQGGVAKLFTVKTEDGRTQPESTPSMDLAPASTLRDVVDNRLPFHGAMNDDATKSFLESSLGDVPEEVLFAPLTVRGKVVGVVYGDSLRTHLFRDHLAAAARAAGLALERILKSRRRTTTL